MTADEILALAKNLTIEANRYRRELDAKQPRTTREEWNAWECLEGAASHLMSTVIWLARHDEMTGVNRG